MNRYQIVTRIMLQRHIEKHVTGTLTSKRKSDQASLLKTEWNWNLKEEQIYTVKTGWKIAQRMPRVGKMQGTSAWF